MKTKNNVQESRNHLKQDVYRLVINYKTYSRSHRHVFLFSITEGKTLLKEVNKLLEYSNSRLIDMYPWLNPMECISFEVSLIPSSEYRIGPAIVPYVGLLCEQICVTRTSDEACSDIPF